MGPRCLWKWRRQEGAEISATSFLARKQSLQGACRWSLMFHMEPVIIPSSPMTWSCNLPFWEACQHTMIPYEGRSGHLQISCGDPNKVFHSVFQISRCLLPNILSFCCLGTGELYFPPRGSDIWSKEWCLNAAHWVASSKRRSPNVCSLYLCLRMSFLSVILPFLMMLGMGHNCSYVSSILYIPGCLPENDFKCYVLAVAETNAYLFGWQGLSKTRTKSGNVEFQSEFCFWTLVLCKKEKN